MNALALNFDSCPLADWICLMSLVMVNYYSIFNRMQQPGCTRYQSLRCLCVHKMTHCFICCTVCYFVFSIQDLEKKEEENVSGDEEEKEENEEEYEDDELYDEEDQEEVS